MLSETDAAQAIGATAYGNDGEKIGKVGQVFLDDRTGAPEFMTVNTGLFGSSESFVPTEGASFDGEGVTLAFSKGKVKDAPKIDLDGDHLDGDEERRLFDYYSMSVATGAGTDPEMDRGSADDLSSADAASGGMTTAPEGHDTSGPMTDDAMTRSEEHLEVGTATQESGRARLRKYVTTEQQTVDVPVRKERVVVESEPVTNANRDEAGAGPEISEEEHEVVLHEERAVVDTVVEPVERVRLGTETHVEDETITGEVRKEQIEVAGDVDERR